MEIVRPRYEFRWFGQNYQPFLQQLESMGSLQREDDSREVYLLSRKANRMSCKVKGNQIDMKELLRYEEGLEQWSVRLKEPLPVSRDVLEYEVLPLLGVHLTLRQEEYDADEIVDKLMPLAQELIAVHVHKRRKCFDLQGCRAEYASVLVNGALIHTLAVESEERVEVEKLRDLLGMGREENLSYPGILKRITGMVPMPSAPLSHH